MYNCISMLVGARDSCGTIASWIAIGERFFVVLVAVAVAVAVAA